jgi:hypothetical protein
MVLHDKAGTSRTRQGTFTPRARASRPDRQLLDKEFGMRSCPVCCSESIASLGRVGSDEAAQHFVLREGDPARHADLRAHIEQLWRGGDCELCRCSSCGFGFSWPYVAGDGRFYNLAYPTIGFPRDKWEFRRTVQAVRALGEPGNDMMALEIGAGFGYFLDMVSPRYIERDRVVAVEYHDECQRSLAAKGYRAVAADIRGEEFVPFRSQFKFVFMFQVLEHMDRLDATMERLRYLAAGGCHLFVAVPNALRIAFNEEHGGLLDMPPNHIGRWTRSAFEVLAKRFGLELVETDVEPMRLLSMAKADLVSSYCRRAQRTGTLANRLRALPRGPWRGLLERALIAGYAPTRLGTWRLGWKGGQELGESIWAHFVLP